jgi:hypothetical protein
MECVQSRRCGRKQTTSTPIAVATMIERAFYSVKEFCERNNISRPTFYRIKWGDLRPVKFGRRTLVPVDCVLPTSLPTFSGKLARDKQRRPETSSGKKPLVDR